MKFKGKTDKRNAMGKKSDKRFEEINLFGGSLAMLMNER
jgi:hypothetical protein